VPELTVSKNRFPLYGLLAVQLLTGIMLMPMSNFLGIFLNEALAFPLSRVAKVIALGQVVGMLASLVGGSLSDRWGKKNTLIVGIAAVSVCCTLYLFRLPWLVLLLWGFGGAGLGFSVLSSQGYLTLAAHSRTLGVFSALYNWGYTIGGAIGVSIAAVILGTDNFAALGMSLAGLGVFTVVFATVLPQLRPAVSQSTLKTGSASYRVLLDRRILLLILLRFLPTCYYGLMTLLPLIIKRQGGSNAVVAGYAAGSAVLASLTQLSAGRMADRKGSRLPTTIAFAMILAAIGGTIITADSVWGLYVFGALGVSAAWALSTLLPGMVRIAAAPQIHGRVFGTLHLMWTSAMILGTLLGGELLEVNVRLPFAIVGILNCIALALTVPFFRGQPGAISSRSQE
jgi:MFS family permease